LDQENKRLKEMEQKQAILQGFADETQRPNTLDQKLTTTLQYLPISKPSLQTLVNIMALARSENVEFSGLTLNPGLVKKNTGDKKDGNNSEIKRNAVASNTPEKGLDNFEITFAIRGEQDKVEDFMIKLKELSPMMKIVSFGTAFSENKDKTTPKLISADLKVLVYYQKLPDTIPPVDAPLTVLTPEEENLLTTLSSSMKKYNYYNDGKLNIPQAQLGNPNPFAVDAHQ
jgi:hypothetical protein